MISLFLLPQNCADGFIYLWYLESRIYLGVKWLDQYTIKFFQKWWNCVSNSFKVFVPFHSHKLCMRIPGLPHLYWYLVWVVFLILSMLIDVQWYPILVLICVSLMTNNIEHLFIGLYIILYTFFVTYFYHLPLPPLTKFFLIIELWEFFMYPRPNCFITYMRYKYFLLICSFYLFIFVTVSLKEQIFFACVTKNVYWFVLLCIVHLVSNLKISLPSRRTQKTSMFSSGRCIILSFIFIYMIQ